MREELERVRKWAIDKIAAGQEPPWAWYQYMKLREAIDCILAGQDATRQMANSPLLGERPENGPRLVVDNCQPANAQRQAEATPTQLPM
jgi:hypothetical protein